jgi:hypothetical protein
MSAFQALSVARAAGVRIRLNGDELDLSAENEPPETVLELLHRHKTQLLRLLGASLDGWRAEDWQAFFDERTAICEFDGSLPRTESEARAFDCCVVEWLNRSRIQSLPGRCLSCGGQESAGNPLLPFGTDETGHGWVHRGCWTAWRYGREAEAVAALASMGIMKGGRRRTETSPLANASAA